MALASIEHLRADDEISLSTQSLGDVGESIWQRVLEDCGLEVEQPKLYLPCSASQYPGQFRDVTDEFLQPWLLWRTATRLSNRQNNEAKKQLFKLDVIDVIDVMREKQSATDPDVSSFLEKLKRWCDGLESHIPKVKEGLVEVDLLVHRRETYTNPPCIPNLTIQNLQGYTTLEELIPSIIARGAVIEIKHRDLQDVCSGFRTRTFIQRQLAKFLDREYFFFFNGKACQPCHKYEHWYSSTGLFNWHRTRAARLANLMFAERAEAEVELARQASLRAAAEAEVERLRCLFQMRTGDNTSVSGGGHVLSRNADESQIDIRQL